MRKLTSYTFVGIQILSDNRFIPQSSITQVLIQEGNQLSTTTKTIWNSKGQLIYLILCVSLGFSCFQIYFYLTLIVREPEEQHSVDLDSGSPSTIRTNDLIRRHEIVVLFERSKPRLDILMNVRNEIQKQLFVAK